MYGVRSAAAGFVTLMVIAVPAISLALIVPKGDYTVTDKREYPIVFIHGAAGADLSAGGENVWPGSLSTNDNAYDVLALKPDGKSPCCGRVVFPTGVLRFGLGDTYMFLGDQNYFPVYQGFYDYMAAQGFGYQKSENGKVFYDFVYDWRQDNRRWSSNLNTKVDQILKETGAEKVILVSHSMGGIQIRLFMNNAGYAKKVGGVIFLAAPPHGAPQVYWAYTYGYNFGNKKVSDTKMWEIMKNWGAGYQLLPDYPFIQDAKDGHVWSLDEMYGEGFISQQEYNHYLAAKSAGTPYTITYGLGNQNLLQQARDVHAQLLPDNVKPYPGVTYHAIVGDGQNTVYALRATLTDVGLDKPLLTLTKLTNKDGDGTVPSQGSRVSGVDTFDKVIGEHGAIPSTPAAQTLVTQYRKEINDETFRKTLHEQAARFAESKLPQAKNLSTAGLGSGPETGDKEENMLLTLFKAVFFGIPNEEKIKARDTLQRDAGNAFKNANVNVEIAASGEKKEDSLYLIIEDFAVTGHGSGSVSPFRYTVHVPSYEVFNDIINSKIDLWEGYKNGTFTVSGSGIFSNLKMRFLAWVSKFAGK